MVRIGSVVWVSFPPDVFALAVAQLALDLQSPDQAPVQPLANCPFCPYPLETIEVWGWVNPLAAPLRPTLEKGQKVGQAVGQRLDDDPQTAPRPAMRVPEQKGAK
jgi:hypothetical protein